MACPANPEVLKSKILNLEPLSRAFPLNPETPELDEARRDFDPRVDHEETAEHGAPARQASRRCMHLSGLSGHTLTKVSTQLHAVEVCAQTCTMNTQTVCGCIHVSMQACMYACIYACTHLRLDACRHACMDGHGCMYACTCVCVSMHGCMAWMGG